MSAPDPTGYAHGYSKTFRAIEIASIAAFLLLQARLMHEFSGLYAAAAWTLLFSVLAGLVAADFISGFVHWMGDTWGTPEWPVLGPALIRPFREHHVDQKALTRHDFIELNGANCLVSIPVLLMVEGAGYWAGDDESVALLLGRSFLTWMTLWVFFTNMFHQWAHREAHENTRLVRWLQARRLILSPEAHAIHHEPPHLDHYCITTGWLSAPLARMRFYRHAERLVTALTGQIPRQGA